MRCKPGPFSLLAHQPTISPSHSNILQIRIVIEEVVIPVLIPDICHGRADGVRVNFFWPVYIFTDLTQKIGNLLCKMTIYCVNWQFTV